MKTYKKSAAAKKAAVNQARLHPVLTLTVIANFAGLCEYKPYHSKSEVTYTFKAMLRADAATLDTMQIGGSYAVRQTVDAFDTTHWSSAVPYSGGAVPTHDPITARIAADRGERKINPNLFDTNEGLFTY